MIIIFAKTNIFQREGFLYCLNFLIDTAELEIWVYRKFVLFSRFLSDCENIIHENYNYCSTVTM